MAAANDDLKRSWPELVGFDMQSAADRINIDRPGVSIFFYTPRKRAIGPGQRYQLLLAIDRPSGGKLAPGGGSNRFQCVTIGTGLNHHPIPNEGGAKVTGL